MQQPGCNSGTTLLGSCSRRGHLIVVEVSSRIKSLPDFIAAVEGLGFKTNKQVRGLSRQ